MDDDEVDTTKKRRSSEGDATVQIPAELLSILPPPAPTSFDPTPAPPPPGPAAPPPPPPAPAPAPAPPRPPRQRAAPIGRGAGAIWFAVVVLVMLIFVVACYLVVAQSEDDRPQGSAGPDPTGEDATTTTASTTTTTAPPTTQDPASLTVVVLNGSGQVGWAGENVATLAESGYTAEASDAAADGDTTTIYVADPALEVDAAAIAAAIGLPDAAIQPKPDTPLGQTPAADGADIVVVLGTDSLG